jgi:hypothetical protein
MNKKYYLPAAASLLIFAMVITSLTPAMAAQVKSSKALPVLEVTTIAEDDQVRHTGVMVFGFPIVASLSTFVSIENCAELKTATGWPGSCQDHGDDKLAQYKMLVTFNGIPVGTADSLTVVCQVYEKDKIAPGVKTQQGKYEQLRTTVTDLSTYFHCKLRPAEPGVFVLDLYYTGPQTKEFIADYGIVITVSMQIGRSTVFGSDLQDVCLLGWSMSSNERSIPKPSPSDPLGANQRHYTWNDALGPFAGCEEATIWQKAFLGFPITGPP